MATVNFSVPSNVKEAFDRAFGGENKSAVLTSLMRQAMDERKRRRRQARAIDRILAFRKGRKPVGERQIQAARSRVRG
jgi:hypothetical protein